MPTLQELRAAHEQTGRALREAEDHLGQARDRARTAIDALADHERAAIDDGAADATKLAAARTEHSEALAALHALRDALTPPRTPRT